MSALLDRPEFDPGTHVTIRCGVCHRWLKPFRLKTSTEGTDTLNHRILQKTGWVVGTTERPTRCKSCQEGYKARHAAQERERLTLSRFFPPETTSKRKR
jgi:hypothetical protein